MRNTLVVFFALGLLACSSEMPTQNDSHLRTAPPTLTISATSRAISNTNGSQDLEVSALLRNSTKSHIALVNGAQCPLFVRIFPDPTGEFSNSLDPSMACPIGGPTDDLPVGKERKLWDATALAERDPVISRMEADAKQEVEVACRNILRRFDPTS